MTEAVASSPGKVILIGEHGVHRGQANITTAVDLRTWCRVTLRPDSGYSLASGNLSEEGSRDRLVAFKAQVDALREANALDELAALTKEFFVPARYVMATLAHNHEVPGFDVEWRSTAPIGSGLGSGAAAFTSMVVAAAEASGLDLSPEEVIFTAWQGDVIAHGGYGSSLDSSTCTYGGLIRYTIADGAVRLPYDVPLPLVIGDTLIEHRTSKVNTHLRLWLEESPSRMHIFSDMGYLVERFMVGLEHADLASLGRLMNIHQLLQEKMGTSCPESDVLVEAAIAGGALGAKISGSGCGGIVIALCQPGHEEQVAASMEATGGKSYVVRTGEAGARLEPAEAWSASVG